MTTAFRRRLTFRFRLALSASISFRLAIGFGLAIQLAIAIYDLGLRLCSGLRFRAFQFRGGCRRCSSTDRFNGVRFAPLSGCSFGTHEVSLAFSSIIAFAILRTYDCLTNAFRIAFANYATLSNACSILFGWCTCLQSRWLLSASFRSRKIDHLRCVSVCFDLFSFISCFCVRCRWISPAFDFLIFPSFLPSTASAACSRLRLLRHPFASLQPFRLVFIPFDFCSLFPHRCVLFRLRILRLRALAFDVSSIIHSPRFRIRPLALASFLLT
jgi:hypothetical protein